MTVAFFAERVAFDLRSKGAENIGLCGKIPSAVPPDFV
jgi:hypothetical protein